MKGLQGEKHRVAESLFAALGRVLLRSQFGGQGVWCDGVMFALIAEGSSIYGPAMRRGATVRIAECSRLSIRSAVFLCAWAITG